MALQTKTITGSTSSSNWTFKLVCIEEFISTENNASLLTVEAYIGRPSSSGSYMYGPSINGTFKVTGCADQSFGYSTSGRIDISAGGWFKLDSYSFSVPHNSDGTKTVDISASFTNNVIPSSGSASGSMELTQIPRYIDTITLTQRSKTSSSISYNWTTSQARDHTQYSLNGGSWIDAGDTVASDNKSGYFTISGLSANTKYSVKIRCKRTDSQLWSESSTLDITTYQKTIPTISLSSKTINSITVTSGCNVSVSQTKYRIKKSGGSYGSYQTSATFTGLSANTTYIIEVYKVGTDSGESGTTTLSVTTYNYATISSAPNFNLGSTETITYSNPSGSTINIGIYTTDSQTVLAGYRTASGSSYTFTFTDTELDKFYKLFSTTNTITVKVYLRTTCNGTNYYSSKEVTITLTGNQKTGHIKLSDTWKRTKRWININGTWKRCVRWININGTWKRCI